MQERLFMAVLDLTVKGSLVILAVLALRLLLARVPKGITYGLWLVVLIRLLCPLELSAPVSLMPALEPVSQDYVLEDVEISFAQAGAAAVGSAWDAVTGGTGVQTIPVMPPKNISAAKPEIQAAPRDIWILFGSYLWAGGLVIMAGYSLVSVLLLKRKLREAVRLENGVYGTDQVETPFVMGLLRPRIYLPLGLEGREKEYILAHERHHIRRFDPIWKALGFLALSIHWFNPLVWAAFILGCRDMEMSCDEAVLKKLGGEIRGDYAAALLKIAAGRRIVPGAPLAFGEGDPKGRIRNLSRWKKPVLWISIVAVILCAILAVGLLTDPVREDDPSIGYNWYFGRLEAVQPGGFTLAWEDGDRVEFINALEDTQLPEPGTWVQVRGIWNGELEAYEARRLETPQRMAYADLQEAAEAAVLLLGGGIREEGQFACASFERIARNPAVGEDARGLVTLYGMGLDMIFEQKNGTIREVSGSHIPVALTFQKEDGGYVLIRYRMPRDGTYYAQDLKAIFPGLFPPDTQDYILRQHRECLEKAQAHFGNSYVPEPTVPSATESQMILTFPGPDMNSIPEDYGPVEAMADGVAMMQNGNAWAHAEAWEEFLRQVELGQPAVVRIMEIGDSAQNYLEELRYDGEIFHLQTKLYYGGEPGGALIREKYPTLGRYANAYEVIYGLSHSDANSNYEPAWSQRNGSGQPVLVFRYAENMPASPQFTQKLVSASLMLEDTLFGRITDPERVGSLEAMLLSAELDSTLRMDFFQPELHLLLEFDDGSRLAVPVLPETDRILVWDMVYDYGPGYVPYEDGYQQYNAILDMVRHFGLEDWPQALSQWLMEHGQEPLHHSLKVIVGEEPHP